MRELILAALVGDRFEPVWAVDALTVNPYLGSDGIDPFVRIAAREEKGVFVLVRTSNVTAGEFQDLTSDGRPVYRHVAEHLARWATDHKGESGYSFVGAVVGATYPGQLAELRGVAGRFVPRAGLWCAGRIGGGRRVGVWRERPRRGGE